MRPASRTSNGSAITVAPSSAARAAASSALSTVTYAFHAGGMPSCAADNAAAFLPSLRSIV
jgi:hypothetical protein